MKFIQIIARATRPEAIKLVEDAFHAAELETALYIFGDDPDRNVMVAVEIAEAQIKGAHPLQVWIVPAAFVDLERTSQERARDARSMIGLSQSGDPQKRLLITHERTESKTVLMSHIIALEDFVNGAISSDSIRYLFNSQ